MAKIRVYDGRLIDPFNIQGVDIVPETFIHQLCLINRFHGATKYPYSVGQHSINLYYLVPTHLKKAALIHDWSEAPFNDLASPVKYECPSYVRAEKEAGKRIASFFGISEALLQDLSPYDKSIYVNERNALFNEIGEEGMGDDRLPLPNEHLGLFGERDWRSVREEFTRIFKKEFPEWV